MPEGERAAMIDGFFDRAAPYARMGWPVYPKAPGCKHPMKDGPTFRDAATDLETVLAWSGQAPRANVGVRTGPASGVMVIDVDDGDWLRGAMLRSGGMPGAPVARTPSGGWHIYFRHEPGLKCRANVLPGVDIRAEGGEITAPVSWWNGRKRGHPPVEGGFYTWARAPLGPVPPAAPGWLLAALRPKERKRPVYKPRSEDEATSLDEIREALRHVDPDMPRAGGWWEVLAAIHSAHPIGGRQVAEEWSRQGQRYRPGCVDSEWKALKPGGITIATLFGYAKRAGYRKCG